MKAKVGMLVLAVMVVAGSYAESITHGGTTINMDFVDIGYAGNIADTRVMTDGTTGYGAVDYDYKIGRYEVTAVQYEAVLAADPNVGKAIISEGNYPATWVSWFEAAKFCNWLTSGSYDQGAYIFDDPDTFTGVDRDTALANYNTVYVLPTEDEWYKAAYLKQDGSGYTLYPTGDTVPVKYTDALYGPQASMTTWEVGSGSIENNDTYDMGGNVSEWNESIPDVNYRKLRGGDFNNSCNLLASTARVSISVAAEYENNVGFRVAAIPEPGSAILVAGIGAFGVFVRRRFQLT